VREESPCWARHVYNLAARRTESRNGTPSPGNNQIPAPRTRLSSIVVDGPPRPYASRDPHARAPFNSGAGGLNCHRSSLLVGRRVRVGQNAKRGFESGARWGIVWVTNLAIGSIDRVPPPQFVEAYTTMPGDPRGLIATPPIVSRHRFRENRHSRHVWRGRVLDARDSSEPAKPSRLIGPSGSLGGWRSGTPQGVCKAQGTVSRLEKWNEEKKARPSLADNG